MHEQLIAVVRGTRGRGRTQNTCSTVRQPQLGDRYFRSGNKRVGPAALSVIESATEFPGADYVGVRKSAV